MLSLKQFVKKYSFKKKKLFVDFETRGPDTSNRFRGCPPSHIPERDFDLLRSMSKKRAEGKMGINFEEIQRREKERLKNIIERDESTTLKIQRVLLWQREKRASELNNLLRYNFCNLANVVSQRAESAQRGVEFMRDMIDRNNQRQQKESTMQTKIDLIVSGPSGVGKNEFLRVIHPLLEMAARMALTPKEGKVQINVSTTNIDPAFAKPVVDEAEMRAALDSMEEAEAKRYAASKRMNELLRDMGYCPKEIKELEAMNDAENHNTLSMVEKTRKDFL